MLPSSFPVLVSTESWRESVVYDIYQQGQRIPLIPSTQKRHRNAPIHNPTFPSLLIWDRWGLPTDVVQNILTESDT